MKRNHQEKYKSPNVFLDIPNNEKPENDLNRFVNKNVIVTYIENGVAKKAQGIFSLKGKKAKITVMILGSPTSWKPALGANLTISTKEICDIQEKKEKELGVTFFYKCDRCSDILGVRIFDATEKEFECPTCKKKHKIAKSLFKHVPKDWSRQEMVIISRKSAKKLEDKFLVCQNCEKKISLTNLYCACSGKLPAQVQCPECERWIDVNVME